MSALRRSPVHRDPPGPGTVRRRERAGGRTAALLLVGTFLLASVPGLSPVVSLARAADSMLPPPPIAASAASPSPALWTSPGPTGALPAPRQLGPQGPSQAVVPTGRYEPPGLFQTLERAHDPAWNPGLAAIPSVDPTAARGPAFASPNWTLLAPAVHPSPRAGGAMAFDVADNEVVLFGGEHLSATGGLAYLNDTWTYRGGVWTNITGSLHRAPSPRYGSFVTFDAADGAVLLVGGYTSSSQYQSLNDSWTFAGGLWTTTTTFPRAIFVEDELTYDAADGYAAFSGIFCEAPCNGQLWAYQAGAWTLKSAIDPGLWWDPLAYDSTDGYVLQIGGNNSYVDYAYLAGAWTRITTATDPPWAGAQPIVDDPAAHAVVFPIVADWGGWWGWPQTLRGGFQTWAYAGGAWSNLTGQLAFSPSMRSGPGFVFDAADGYLLLFGGATATTDLSDTWAFTSAPGVVLTAQASASVHTGAAPLSVQLSATVAGGTPPYAYTWDFGDGSGPSTLANPTHVYTRGGHRSPQVTVVDANGLVAGASTWMNVSLGAPLTVSATAAPTTGPAPLAVQFAGTATGGYGNYSTWWSLGTGEGYTANPAAVHTYNLSGVFQANFSAGDSLGASQSKLFTITVTSPTSPAPLVVAAVGTPTSGGAPLNVSFSGGASGGAPPYAYVWDFGDGSPTSSAASTWHVYSAPGGYVATLTVTDSQGTTAGRPVNISVSGPTGGLVLSASANPSAGTVPLTVAFSSSVTGGVPPYNLTWSFGDGGRGWGTTTTHTYLAAGNFYPAVLATDGQGDAVHFALGAINVTVPVTGPQSSSEGPLVGVVVAALVGVAGGALLLWGVLLRARSRPRAGGASRSSRTPTDREGPPGSAPRAVQGPDRS